MQVKLSWRFVALAFGFGVAGCGGGSEGVRTEAADRGASAVGAANAATSTVAIDSSLAESRATLPRLPAGAGRPVREQTARLQDQDVLPPLDRSKDIRGLDANENGVRDDIDAYIAALPLLDAQRKAALQTARKEQATLLVDPTDKAAVRALSERSIAATKCLGDTFEPNREASYPIGLKIEAITANTPERAKRSMRYMAALSGTSVAYPETDTCEK